MGNMSRIISAAGTTVLPKERAVKSNGTASLNVTEERTVKSNGTASLDDSERRAVKTNGTANLNDAGVPITGVPITGVPITGNPRGVTGMPEEGRIVKKKNKATEEVEEAESATQAVKIAPAKDSTKVMDGKKKVEEEEEDY